MKTGATRRLKELTKTKQMDKMKFALMEMMLWQNIFHCGNCSGVDDSSVGKDDCGAMIKNAVLLVMIMVMVMLIKMVVVVTTTIMVIKMMKIVVVVVVVV